MIPTVAVTRYVTPLREGGSLPGIVEADDLGTYVCKFRGAGQGVRVLVAEVVVSELARLLGLRTPRLAVLDAAIDECESASAVALSPGAPWEARRLVERLALTLQASLLVRHSPGPVAEAFVASRLGGAHGSTFGTLGRAVGPDAVALLLERALAD